MKPFRILPFLVLLVAFLPFSPARAIEVQRVVSDRGIEAWLVEDHTLPILSVNYLFRDSGAITDPQGKSGRAYMTAGLLNEGAGEIEALVFQRRLEDLAIHMGFDASQDHFSGSLKTLTENREEAFRLLGLALSEPRFDAEPVERVRSQILAGLSRDLQDPNVVAARRWFALQFPDHPYGTPLKGTPESVEAITVEDLRAFVDERFARGNLIVGVVGDITAEELKPLLDTAFGDLPEEAPAVDVAQVQPAAPGELVVERRPIPQSTVIFGHQGLGRADPEWYAALAMNYILGGGGFSSRLMEEVRAKRGLAYGIYTYLQPMDYAPLIVGSVGTRNERVAETLELVRSEWARMRDEGPTQEELDAAKEYLIGSFPLRLTSTSAIAGMLVAIQLDDLGIDYIDKRNDYLEAVGLEDVKRVAARLLHPDRLTAVVVGEPLKLAASQ